MSRPHVICERCHGAQADVWISQFWLYCSHFRAMARRRHKSDKWTIDRNTSPDKARTHIETALGKMHSHCAERGLTLEQAMAGVQRLFESDKESPWDA